MSEDVFEVDCPNCRTKMKLKIQELKPGRIRRCPGCGESIRFEGTDPQKEIDKIMKNIRKGIKF
jgi:hypothetical protein